MREDGHSTLPPSNFEPIERYLHDEVGVTDLDQWESNEMVYLAYQVARELILMSEQLRCDTNRPPASIWLNTIRNRAAFASVVEASRQETTVIVDADPVKKTRSTESTVNSRHQGVKGAIRVAEDFLDSDYAPHMLQEGEALVQFEYVRGEKKYWAMRHVVHDREGNLDEASSGFAVYNVTNPNSMAPVIMFTQSGKLHANRLLAELEQEADELLSKYRKGEEILPARIVANMPVKKTTSIGTKRANLTEVGNHPQNQPMPTAQSVAKAIVSAGQDQGAVLEPDLDTVAESDQTSKPLITDEMRNDWAEAADGFFQGLGQYGNNGNFSERSTSLERNSVTILDFPCFNKDTRTFTFQQGAFPDVITDEYMKVFAIRGIYPRKLHIHYIDGGIHFTLEYPGSAGDIFDSILLSSPMEQYLLSLDEFHVHLYNRIAFLINENFNGWRDRFLQNLREMDITDLPIFPLGFKEYPYEQVKDADSSLPNEEGDEVPVLIAAAYITPPVKEKTSKPRIKQPLLFDEFYWAEEEEDPSVTAPYLPTAPRASVDLGATVILQNHGWSEFRGGNHARNSFV